MEVDDEIAGLSSWKLCSRSMVCAAPFLTPDAGAVGDFWIGDDAMGISVMTNPEVRYPFSNWVSAGNESALIAV